jgi:hypothetical protein
MGNIRTRPGSIDDGSLLQIAFHARQVRKQQCRLIRVLARSPRNKMTDGFDTKLQMTTD